MRIPGTEELQGHLHDFFTGQFAAGKVVENHFTVFLEEPLAFCNTGAVVVFKLEPPI